MIASKGDGTLNTEVKCLCDEVLTLKMAIEEAIIKGQKSFGRLSDITESGVTTDEEPDLIDVDGGSGLVGWVDDI